MTTLKQIMNLVDAYGSERCSGNEYDNRYAEKRARDAVVSALKEYAPQRPSHSDMTWVGLTPQERDEINEQVYGAVPHHVAFHAAIEAKLREKNSL